LILKKYNTKELKMVSQVQNLNQLLSLLLILSKLLRREMQQKRLREMQSNTGLIIMIAKKLLTANQI